MKMKTSYSLFKRAIVIAVVYFSAILTSLQAQNDLNVGYYPSYASTLLDTSVLDDVFDTVRVNGSVVTGDTNIAPVPIPTTVSALSGFDVVCIDFGGGRVQPNQNQADALIDYVKQGGILMMGGTENNGVTGTLSHPVPYIANALYCPSEGVNITVRNITGGSNPAQKLHPGNGPLLFSVDPGNIRTTTSYDAFPGVPSEGIILAGRPGACSGTGALEFIVPSYPCASACGVNGFAIFNGEIDSGTSEGPLFAGDTFFPPGSPGKRDNSQLNQDIAQLVFDFLYNPVAMTARYTWTSNPANTSATCPPTPLTLPCSIKDPGAIAGTCNPTNNDLEFSLNLAGISIGTTYSVTGATSATGTYGTPTMFMIASGADGTDKMVTVTDDTDASCTLDITITGATACFSCDSGADAPRFLGLTKSTWMTIGIVTAVGASVSILLKKLVF